MHYKDEIEKIKYLKKRIARSLAALGVYPDCAAIDSRLSSIDAKLALFRHKEVKESSLLDVKQMNEDFMNIYQDLLILYRLVFEFKLNKLEQTKAFVETHLSELETLAETYKKKNDLETGSTSVGKTLFFQSSGFNQWTENYVTKINLGEIKVSPGSRISCFIQGRYFKPENVRFTLGELSCPPFALNRDYVKIPGEPKYRSYKYKIPEDLTPGDIIELMTDKFKPSAKNSYTVFGGENCISSYFRGANKIIHKNSGEAILLDNPIGKITFYIIGGTYVNFEFSKAPLSQNFSGYSIQNMQKHKKIVIEYEGPFSFNFNTNGTIYATKNRGILKGERLFYPGNEKIRDFLIEEYSQKEYKTYNSTVTIQQTNEYVPHVNMIAIKELSKFDEDFDYD